MQRTTILDSVVSIDAARRASSWALLAIVVWPTLANAIAWPQQIASEEGTIVVYQPQPERLEGNQLEGRAAFSLDLKDREELIFGALWFNARIDTDRDAGIVLVRDLKVTRVGWPDSKDAGEQRLTNAVEAALPENGFEISLERLTASLETAEIERESLKDLKTDPPAIIFREQPAVLLLYDGDPHFSPVENSAYQRALNTTFLVVGEKGGTVYLSNGAVWYEAEDPLGPWQPTNSPPADLVAMLPKPEADDPLPKVPPEIVVATKPTELIATDGEPNWRSLDGGELLYVQNTETAWLRELATSNMYVLLSGRWYRSKTATGPWTFVRSDELPKSFAEIPPASDIGGLRVSVAGTEEAEEAVLDSAVPQTTAIDRASAKLEVEYDGTPKFEKVPGTRVAYAVNTGAQVLEIDKQYYAVDSGVWFTSISATGPWSVADSVPGDEIAKIPPSSPVYIVTHVHVYESTPEVVYVGYTPGYLWSFPYYGAPVYGTGWYYPPYYGRYYYPRPPTWGFNVGYNPWTGWNFGLSWSNGFFTFGVSWGGGWGGAYRPWGCCGGWYGGGYRRPVVINTGDINIGNNVNIGNRTNIKNRIGNNTTINVNRLNQSNLYNRSENRTRNASSSLARNDLKRAEPLTQRANNVFADRDGNVARRTEKGDWESRRDGSWKPEAPAGLPQARDNVADTRPQTRTSTGFDRSGFDRAHQARRTGVSRERARPSGMSRRR